MAKERRLATGREGWLRRDGWLRGKEGWLKRDRWLREGKGG
jgi:hypothetical protein